MPELNASTAILLNFAVSALMYLALRAIRRALPEEGRAIEAWAWGYACFAVSALLFLTRGELSPFLTMTVPGAVMSFGMVFLCQGFYRFRGRDLSTPFMLTAGGMLVAAHAAFTYLWPSQAARSLLIALSGVTTHAAIIRLYLDRHAGKWRIGERLMLVAIGCAFLAYALRLWGLSLVDRDHATALQGTGSGAYFFAYLVLLNLAQILLANGLLVLTQERIAQRLRDAISHDSLTGALSRRAIMGMLDVARVSVARNGDRWAVIMVDLDRFKAINDEHGHTVGDEVLAAVVATMRENLRLDSHLGRYGGEEFLVVARIRASEEGQRLAERIRAAVAAQVIRTAAGPVRCTVSAGVAELDEAGLAQGEDALQQADRALYEAKRAGRNRVRLARVGKTAPAAGGRPVEAARGG